MEQDVSGALQAIRLTIEASCAASLLCATKPELIAVSKGQDVAAIRKALAAGQRHFGENRVQEAEHKWVALKQEFADIVLHLIGSLQSNKAKEAVALFDVIHTVDRAKIAELLAHERKMQKRQVVCLIQVNTGEEPQKNGVIPTDMPALLAHCLDVGLPVCGLMCIPPAQENPSPHFALLHKMAKEADLSELSMGMSEDYQTAIRFGATYVRVGTAIFGKREHQPDSA